MLRGTIEGVVSPTTRSGHPPRAPSRAELLAALSVAIDLGLGQPAEHMLRAALIGTRIADRLGLSPNTVKNHVKSILVKLEVDDRTQAATAAIQRGIVHLP